MRPARHLRRRTTCLHWAAEGGCGTLRQIPGAQMNRCKYATSAGIVMVLTLFSLFLSLLTRAFMPFDASSRHTHSDCTFHRVDST